MPAELLVVCRKCGRECCQKDFYRSVSDCCRACHDARCLAGCRKNPARHLHNSTRRSAKERGLAYELDVAWFSERINRGACEITGIPFGEVLAHDPYAPSPDRIDNSVGYTPSNTRLILGWLNKGKHTLPEDVFQKCLSDLTEAMHEQARAG